MNQDQADAVFTFLAMAVRAGITFVLARLAYAMVDRAAGAVWAWVAAVLVFVGMRVVFIRRARQRRARLLTELRAVREHRRDART